MAIIRNLTASAIALDDLAGITIDASADYDLKEENQNDIANSQDLNAAITAGNVVFLDPLGNPLSQQESLDTQNNISSTQPAIIIQDNGVNAVGTPHSSLNFIGNDVSIVDAGNGIADIDLFQGLAFSTIFGQEILTLVDTSRANKILSVEKVNFLYSNTVINDGTYFKVGELFASIVGYIMPMTATIVGLALQKIGGTSITVMEYDLYVNDTLTISGLTVSNDATEQTKIDNTLDIDLAFGDKIGLRGRRIAGSGDQTDVSIVLYVRWRL